MREEKIYFVVWDFGEAGLRRFRGVRRARCLFRLQAENADLIGFRGADLPDPHDTETGFTPAAADFDGLAGLVRKPMPSKRAPSC